jgi:hypothetical protein
MGANKRVPKRENRAIIEKIDGKLHDILFTAECLEKHAKDMKFKKRWHYVNNSVQCLREYVKGIRRLLKDAK